jgi:hypothetical protein
MISAVQIDCAFYQFARDGSWPPWKYPVLLPEKRPQCHLCHCNEKNAIADVFRFLYFCMLS